MTRLRELCSRAADLALGLPQEASTVDDVGTFMTRQWNLDLTRAAGWMARTIIQMCDQGMKETWLVERALMELVANQAVLNESPENALRFSIEEHNFQLENLESDGDPRDRLGG